MQRREVPAGTRCLMVTDRADGAHTVVEHLRATGFQVLRIDHGAAVTRALAGWTPQVVLVDAQLPDMPGVEVCAAAREEMPTAVVALLADDPDLDLRITALGTGADDVLDAAGSALEISARLGAALRRVDRLRSMLDTPTGVLTTGSITLDPLRHEVFVGDRRTALTPLEFDLLHLLMAHPGEALNRSLIIDAVWGIDASPGSNVVDRQIGTLRRKLQPESHERRPSAFIETVPRIGYRLVASLSPARPVAASAGRGSS